MEKDSPFITKFLGGGTSWYYLIHESKVLDASHEDDKEGMNRIKQKAQEIEQEQTP